MGNINSEHVTVDNKSNNPILTKETTGIVPKEYDYIDVTAGVNTDTYVYKTGGASGTAVATVTVTWTDSTKSQIDSILRT